MKVLVFHIGADRYALRLPAIVRVLPAAALKAVPLAPPAVAGLLDLQGVAVPVIDLSRLAGMAAEQVWFDSRIILIDYAPDAGPSRPLGLLAEHVMGIEEFDAASLAPAGVTGAPFLGQVGATAHGLLQLVEPAQLLGPELRALLFQDREPA
jgi:chemotaxis-related protein WspB